MSVTPEEVRRIGELAHLRPDDEELDRLTGELNAILEYMATLAEAEVSPTEEDANGLPSSFRDPDAPPDPLHGGGPSALAPEWRDGFFLVPRLPGLEGGE